MTESKNRRGAILVLAAFTMVVVLAMLVAVVDLSRAFMQKNELQTSIDAAALAGVLELYSDTALVDDSAISFGLKNKVLKLSPTINSAGVRCGVWDNVAVTFTASAGCNLSDNAVEVTGGAPVQSSIASFMSLGNKQLASKAVAWLAYVEGTKCIKPFGLPYTALTYVLRPDLGNPVDPDPLRALTEGDLYRLRTYTRNQLRFELKDAAGGELNGPGNFGPVDLNGGGGGSSAYEDAIVTCDDTQLGPGSQIDTEAGNMVGNTIDGVMALCNSYSPMIGDECRSAPNKMGVPILAPLWYSSTKVTGRKTVTIIQIGAFKLDSLTSDNKGGNKKASIIGHFVGFAGGGSIGSTPTAITRPILVK